MRLNFDSPTISITIGIFSIILALIMYSESGIFIPNSSTTKGRIIEIISIKTNHEKQEFYPIIEFNTVNGNRIRFQSDKNYQKYKTPKIGDEVDIIYNSKKPTHVKIKNTQENQKWHTLIIGGFGLVFTLLGVGSLINNKKTVKKIGYE